MGSRYFIVDSDKVLWNIGMSCHFMNFTALPFFAAFLSIWRYVQLIQEPGFHWPIHSMIVNTSPVWSLNIITSLVFSIYLEWYSQLANIFQRGWNHQPEYHEYITGARKRSSKVKHIIYLPFKDGVKRSMHQYESRFLSTDSPGENICPSDFN